MADTLEHKVVAHDAWLEARKQFLVKGTDFTRLRDQLSQARRDLPWERVDKRYVFEGPNGQETLPETLRRQEPADRLPLHVHSGVGGGVPALLAVGRQLQRHHR